MKYKHILYSFKTIHSIFFAIAIVIIHCIFLHYHIHFLQKIKELYVNISPPSPGIPRTMTKGTKCCMNDTIEAG